MRVSLLPFSSFSCLYSCVHDFSLRIRQAASVCAMVLKGGELGYDGRPLSSVCYRIPTPKKCGDTQLDQQRMVEFLEEFRVVSYGQWVIPQTWT